MGEAPGRVKGRLQADGRGGGSLATVLKLREHGVEQGQAGVRVVVAGEERVGVGRVVVARVEVHELGEGQVRDALRVAAGVQPVAGVREQRALGVLGEQALGRGIRALHLVEHNALVGQRLVHSLYIKVPALLLQRVPGQAREEHGVQVDINKVVEVLHIGAGHGVAGLVREGQGVEERVQRALDELHKGLLDRVLLGAAQDAVLQDVRQAGVVRRRGA